MKEVRILIGIPASGKSTFAKNFASFHKGYKIVSTDDIRWKLFGNPSIQGNPKMIFAIAYKDIMSYLDKGSNVIFDATNISRKKWLITFQQTVLSMPLICTQFQRETSLNQWRRKLLSRED